MGKPFHDHFSNVASRYAEFRPRYPAALFDWLATLVRQNAVVWDCAAGSGQASMDLAERFACVVATDVSADQIAPSKLHSRIEFRVEPAEQRGLPGELIPVSQALHWFDRERFYAEVRRVLLPTGVLDVWAYGINRTDDTAINDVSSTSTRTWWDRAGLRNTSWWRRDTEPSHFRSTKLDHPDFAWRRIEHWTN